MAASLPEKWGDENIWLRALLVKSNLIWIFRDEFPRLLADKLEWLDAILKDAYLVAGVQARRASSDEDAFNASIELVKNNIEQRILTLGTNDELERLAKLTERIAICDPLQLIFAHLAKQTRNVYGSAFARKTTLEAKWMNDHPLKAARAGDYPDPYHVTAQTAITGNTARVQMKVHLDGFGVKSLLATPALLTHELVCHAHARESGYDNRSIWAEGVMDWTARTFFRKWAPGIDLPNGNIDEHGNILWERRANNSRLTGRYAAATLMAWWANDRSMPGVDAAHNQTSKLAVDVNSFEAPLVKKDHLATRLANIRNDRELQELLRAWRTGDCSVSDLLG